MHRNLKYRFLYSILFLFVTSVFPQSSEWKQSESENFIVIYRPGHAEFVPHIISSAEKALKPLMELFNYTPSEKIIINTYDYSDYGKAGTTTLPQNFIRFEIAPLELSYETMPFNDRVQWIISHELVHIIVNDQSTSVDGFWRKLFSKAPPESIQPLTAVYSYITSPERFTPRWHQEGIAAFLETWFSGGYGRALGNFDEMYFRSLILENGDFPSPHVLEAKTSYNSFLLETLFYLYGTRFCTYLSQRFGVDRLIEWYSAREGSTYSNFEQKFEEIYGEPMLKVWQDWTNAERKFQTGNLNRLNKAQQTLLSPLSTQAFGWVTEPHPDPQNNEIVFGYHKPHHLTNIIRFNPQISSSISLGSIPTPSMLEVASTAYDPKNKRFFYTTNNNKFFRDIHVLKIDTGEEKLLFEDCRVGHISVAEETLELYGIRHSAGRTTLVYSAYPYNDLLPLVDFGISSNLQHLSLSRSGKYLTATLHQVDGSQLLIWSDLQKLKNGENFSYVTISSDGSPEHPSWSADEKFIYWNAYTNGVSNIYRYSMETGEINAISHTLRGLFKPVQWGADSIFAFEFTTQGFIPVLLANKAEPHLPAIEYYGQKVLEKDPQIANWAVPDQRSVNDTTNIQFTEKSYSAFGSLNIHSLVPVISGFQKQKVLGLFGHIADPLYVHDLTFEVGFTPDPPNKVAPRFHILGKYEYKRKIKVNLEHNASNFFDLFNERKRGMIGNRITLGYSFFWKYDIPHKIKQVSEVSFYTGIEAINDNLVRVSIPDFTVLQSVLNSSDTRRAIGSVDAEQGTNWSLTAMYFEIGSKNLEFVGGGHAELELFMPWMWAHNVLQLKFSAGYRQTQRDVAIGYFYFGGFGNRYVEPAQVKQYRKVFRFPGLSIYSLPTDRFGKVMIEHNLPPLRFGNAYLGQHYLSYIDFSWYSQGLVINSPYDKNWVDLGAQLNFHFKHLYNFDTAISFGAARAWSGNSRTDEFFISLKLFK
jgi:hypothetical protein